MCVYCSEVNKMVTSSVVWDGGMRGRGKKVSIVRHWHALLLTFLVQA